VTLLRQRRVGGLLAVAVLVGVLLVACGAGGDSGGGSAYVEPKGKATQSLTIKTGNFFFDPNKATASPGITKLELQGSSGGHTLVFQNAYSGFQLEVVGDSTDTKKIDLKPGKYTFYCDIVGHRQQGMEGTLTVK
jgi:plastocyanin